MLKLIVFVFVAFLLTSCSSVPLSKRGHIQLCGRRLAEALNLFCQGLYYDPDEANYESKRGVSRIGVPFTPGWFLGFSSHRHEPKQIQVAHSSHRQQRGVVDECCKQPCPSSTLYSYCGSK